MQTETQTETSETKGKGNAKGANGAAASPGTARSKRGLLRGEDAILAQLKDDVTEVLDRVGPSFLRALHAARGREKGGIVISCVFMPGGEKSDKQFKISPALTIKGEPIERSADFVDNQLEMYP